MVGVLNRAAIYVAGDARRLRARYVAARDRASRRHGSGGASMTFSYNDTLKSDKDKVRQLLGDTYQDDALVSDEAIAVYLAQYGNIYYAAAALADGIATRFARMPSMSFSGLSIQGSDRANAYRELAITLRNQATVA